MQSDVHAPGWTLPTDKREPNTLIIENNDSKNM